MFVWVFVLFMTDGDFDTYASHERIYCEMVRNEILKANPGFKASPCVMIKLNPET